MSQRAMAKGCLWEYCRRMKRKMKRHEKRNLPHLNFIVISTLNYSEWNTNSNTIHSLYLDPIVVRKVSLEMLRQYYSDLVSFERLIQHYIVCNLCCRLDVLIVWPNQCKSWCLIFYPFPSFLNMKQSFLILAYIFVKFKVTRLFLKINSKDKIKLYLSNLYTSALQAEI